jgi:Fic family protein
MITTIEREMIDHSNRIEEVHGYDALLDALEAWEYQKVTPITLESILETHRLIMRRLNPDIAGKLRDCDVRVGGILKSFIAYTLFEENLNILCNKLKVNSCIRDIDKHTRDCHIEFEFIHPFEDGNGRVGRIIYNTHRFNLGLPIHVIHEGDEQKEYYEWFRSK